MVLRIFGARDNEALTISTDSPTGTPGTAIINNSDTPNGTIFTYNDGFPNLTLTIDDTSADTNTFNDDEVGSHQIVDGQGIVSDGANVESESLHFVRELDADGNPVGPQITITVFSEGGVTQNIWGMATDIPLKPGAQYVKVGGSNNGDSEYATFVPCFSSKTAIMTPSGERLAGDLKVGDVVVTKDHGHQTVRFIARRQLKFPAATDHLKPIVFSAGSLGNGLPVRELVVSPQHRMLLPDDDGAEVLCLAKGLTRLPGVRIKAGCKRIEYIHLLFDRHEILFAEGAPTESFRPGPVAISSMEQAVQNELFEIFPDLRTNLADALGEPARPILTFREVRELIQKLDKPGRQNAQAKPPRRAKASVA